MAYSEGSEAMLDAQLWMDSNREEREIDDLKICLLALRTLLDVVLLQWR